MNKRAIILFTRVPLPGQTKTRLEPGLSPDECAAFHEAVLRDLSQTVAVSDADMHVFFTPGEHADTLRGIIGHPWPFHPQTGGNLGERMHNAMAKVLTQGYESCILIGSDVPQMTAGDIRRAFKRLEYNDAVIAPTDDGGYYLIGIKKPCPAIFQLEYGGETVYESTRARFKALKMTWGECTQYPDMDEFSDLRRLWELAARQDAVAYPHTKAFLTSLHREGRL